jgi:hypothetical protein
VEDLVKKNMGWIAGLWIGMTLAATCAQGQGVKVNVPFQFRVSGETLPAGVYVFSSRRDRVLIRSAEGNASAMALVNGVSGRSSSTNGRVVFRCYARECFLSQLWNPAEDGGHQLLKSREEEKAAKREPGTYFALVGLSSKK